jgi:uncharacterized protein (DUF1697 family)
LSRQIALLRAVNVAAHNRVAMDDLRELMERLGYEDVRTLLQTGNVVFSGDDSPDAAARRIEQALAADLGVKSQVLVRTQPELANVVARNPLASVATDPKKLVVMFLSGKPDAAWLRELDPAKFQPERFTAHGREVYAWLPGGLGRSRLLASLTEKRLKVTATTRNWSTVEKLLALAEKS